MRKFVTAGIGVAALAATVGLAAPAQADTAHRVARPGDGFQSAAASTAAAGKFKRIGKVHKFQAQSVRGAKVWGHWYWARRGNGPSFVYLVTKIKDTRSDGKNAGMCYDLITPTDKVRDRCFVNTKGYGKTLRVAGDLSDWNHTKMRIQAAVGKVKGDTFYVSAQGRWLKLH
jgi:hypothetical protein